MENILFRTTSRDPVVRLRLLDYVCKIKKIDPLLDPFGLLSLSD